MEETSVNGSEMAGRRFTLRDGRQVRHVYPRLKQTASGLAVIPVIRGWTNGWIVRGESARLRDSVDGRLPRKALQAEVRGGPSSAEFRLLV